jgi:hypothetical protein
MQEIKPQATTRGTKAREWNRLSPSVRTTTMTPQITLAESAASRQPENTLRKIRKAANPAGSTIKGSILP